MIVAMVYPEVFDLARFNEKRKEFPPFGVMYLSAMMEGKGHAVTVFSISKEKPKLDLRGFDAIGFSIPSSATFGVTKTARTQSQYSGNPLIMVGGVHANLYPEQTLRGVNPDVVGIGECEHTILEILEKNESRDFSGIEGVCYWDGEQPKRTKPRAIGRDIDWLPMPSRHLLPLNDVVMTNRLSNTNIKMAHVMFTRGCPFPCRFCAVAQSKIQFRSGASARKELILIKEQYGVQGFAIVDDNFVVDKKMVYDVATTISDLGLKWSGLSRVDTVDRDLLTAMFNSGCIEIKFGMESGSERILELMDKRTNPKQIEDTARIAHSIGIKVKLFLVHGYPGEDMQSTNETIRLLQKITHLVDRVSLFRFSPLPGTYVYEHGKEFNLHGTDKDPDWDGNWDKYHIYHNSQHWWGTEAEFHELNRAYHEIQEFISTTWPETNKVPA